MNTVDLVNDVIKPTPKQREFMRTVLNNTYVLYGGAAGGGKSYLLRWMLVYLLIHWFKKTGIRHIRVGLFCETFPTLKDRQLSKIKYEFPDWLGSYKETDKEFTLNDVWGGGVICFRNLDDTQKYLSAEFAAIAIDELTMNDQATFDILRMRLRWVGIDDTKLIAGTNPGGRGHMWVKSLFIDRNFTAELEPLADKIAFVQARMDDNPHLPSSYIQAMDTLPEKLRKAYREGDWNIFEGQVFGEYRSEIHEEEPFPIPASWQKLGGFDWGYSKPYAGLCGAVDFDGVVHIYAEDYGCKEGQVNVGTQETAREVAKKIKARNIPLIFGDPAIWQKTGHDGPSLAEVFASEGVYLTRADNARLEGKMQVHLRLKEHKIKIFKACTNLIRTLPALTYDKHNVEDVDTEQEDHLYDALRYLLMSRPITPIQSVAPAPNDYRETESTGEVSAWAI